MLLRYPTTGNEGKAAQTAANGFTLRPLRSTKAYELLDTTFSSPLIPSSTVRHTLIFNDVVTRKD
ncbi:MAG: hypothetical protein R2788_26710 [Saprospiraceae bacterium]